jgi:hypothetical protein
MASAPNSATMNGTLWAIRPEINATSRDNRHSFATTGASHTMALYACARSLALFVASIVPFVSGSVGWLLAVAWSMIIVQGLDAVVGMTIKDNVKTFGPAGTALLNLAAVIWLIQST